MMTPNDVAALSQPNDFPKSFTTKVVTPKEFGFHCNGECWNEFGAHHALLKTLEEKGGTSFRDWFVNAEWSLTPPEVHVFPKLSEIHATQNYLNMNSVRLYQYGHHRGVKRSFERFPSLFRINEQLFMFQGTHRVAAAYLRGDTSLTGWIIDLDKEFLQ